METVFPGGNPTVTAPPGITRKAVGHHVGVRNPVMLIRIRPTDMPKVVKRK
ncbi:hypothetical protein I552_0270, partial [Mycobacterium xenopi 3993]